MRYRSDGTYYRPITPLEAIYYHERLDLVTHPLIKGIRFVFKVNIIIGIHSYIEFM
jgi:hypothetical protein